MKSSGPNVEPCGTPHSIGWELDRTLLASDLCDLWSGNF